MLVRHQKFNVIHRTSVEFFEFYSECLPFGKRTTTKTTASRVAPDFPILGHLGCPDKIIQKLNYFLAQFFEVKTHPSLPHDRFSPSVLMVHFWGLREMLLEKMSSRRKDKDCDVFLTSAGPVPVVSS